MIHSILLSKIMKDAEKLRIEYGGEKINSAHIALAVDEFCRTRYIGFSVSDAAAHPVHFEEERLRYLYDEKLDFAAFFKLVLMKNRHKKVEENEFDFEICEKIALQRGESVLSSNIVFLCALQDFQKKHNGIVKTELTDEAVLSILQDVDNTIYDYVIGKVSEVIDELKAKIQKAIDVRDWAPKPKFAEPDELSKTFFGAIQKEVTEKTVILKFPKFFGSSSLKVSIYKVGDIYYIHDNGSAIRHLGRNVGDRTKREKIVNRICDKCWKNGSKIMGSFITARQFIYYLEQLIFIAHGDLYYTKAERPLYCKDKSFVFPSLENTDKIDADELFEELKNAISFEYDENVGLYYWLDSQYSLFNTRPAFLLETLQGRQIRISDKRKGDVEGSMFEAFYWDNRHLQPFYKFLFRFSDRFGAYFDGEDVFLNEKQSNFINAIFRFYNLAVLFSEFGNNINLPKLRK